MSERHGGVAKLRWQGLLMVLDAVALLAVVALPLVVALRWLRRGSGLPGFREKCLGPCASRKLDRGGVVVHGVSLGEVGLMGLVVPRLEEVWRCHCVLTTSTATGMQALERQWAGHSRAWLPFDLPWAGERFLDRTRPRALVLLELELWPRLLAACHRRRIPVYVINGRVSARSYRGYRRGRALLRPLLRPLRLALAQNALWGARLRSLGVERVQVGGSLKADLVRITPPAQAAELADRLGLDAQRPLLLVASTSGEEELPCVSAWRSACPGHQLVICPRHPERGPALAETYQLQGLAVWLWSRDGEQGPAGFGDGLRVWIVDTIGKLGALYARADIAIVGGSLGSGRHGQNMLEAAAHGCATIVGLDTSNFPDAMALLREAEAVIEAAPEELPAVLAGLANDPLECQRLARAGHQAWLEARGASEVCQRLLAAAPPPSWP